MLYNPAWKNPTVTHPSLQGFIEWAKTKDPNEIYQYDNIHGRCMCGQYLNAIGLKWDHDQGPGSDFWLTKEAAPLRLISAKYPHTFGAAIKRAEARLALGAPQ